MAHLTLVSPQGRPLQPLVEAAIQNELRLLEAGLRRTEEKLHDFEIRFGMTTPQFVQRYEADELEETLEFIEWVGEYRLRERLLDKTNTLREIRFAN
jgi:hypothetical protein